MSVGGVKRIGSNVGMAVGGSVGAGIGVCVGTDVTVDMDIAVQTTVGMGDGVPVASWIIGIGAIFATGAQAPVRKRIPSKRDEMRFMGFLPMINCFAD
jgi:hypothetical protein